MCLFWTYTLEHSWLFQLSTLVNWYISLQRKLNNLLLKLLMERIAYESVNIITPLKLITFFLRNKVLLQPQPDDLNKMYFFWTSYIYTFGLEIHFITFCYYLDLHSIKVDIHIYIYIYIHIYIHTGSWTIV